jgi:hypothetical protein
MRTVVLSFVLLPLLFRVFEVGRNVYRSEYNSFSLPLRERKLMSISY